MEYLWGEKFIDEHFFRKNVEQALTEDLQKIIKEKAIVSCYQYENGELLNLMIEKENYKIIIQIFYNQKEQEIEIKIRKLKENILYLFSNDKDYLSVAELFLETFKNKKEIRLLDATGILIIRYNLM